MASVDNLWPGSDTPEDAIVAIKNATEGPIEQGAAGVGMGMIPFDSASGIGPASRVLSWERCGYTFGVLAQSDFGRMRGLTVGSQFVG